MKIHHVGYLVKNIGKAQEKFQQLGFDIIEPSVYDEYRKVDISFMEKDGYVIELVASAAPDSVVAGLYRKCRNAPYHLCYSASDFDLELETLTGSGFVQMDRPCPAPALKGKRVVFLMSAVIGMIELLEE